MNTPLVALFISLWLALGTCGIIYGLNEKSTVTVLAGVGCYFVFTLLILLKLGDKNGN